jgi:hypothetical protein
MPSAPDVTRPPRLAELQGAFFRVIARPAGAERSLDEDRRLLVASVQRRGALDACARIEIYAGMYEGRLLEVLGEDFPKVAAVLGGERFSAVASAYLRENPSPHPSLRNLGRVFADFLGRQTEIVADLPFVADLARLEWARLRVFDAPEESALTMASIGDLAAEEWARLRLRLLPDVELMESEWPLDEIWKSGRADGVAAAATSLRIWRSGFTVYHAKVDAIEDAALAAVRRPGTFADVCDALEPLTGEHAAEEGARLLLRWLEDGILAV